MASVSPDVVWREVGGEIVILDLRKGAYYGLKATGAAIWKAMSRRVPVGTIARRMARSYGVSAGRALRDVERLAARLARKGLVRLR